MADRARKAIAIYESMGLGRQNSAAVDDTRPARDMPRRWFLFMDPPAQSQTPDKGTLPDPHGVSFSLLPEVIIDQKMLGRPEKLLSRRFFSLPLICVDTAFNRFGTSYILGCRCIDSLGKTYFQSLRHVFDARPGPLWNCNSKLSSRQT